MSVSNTVVKQQYVCNGVTTTFAIPFAWLITSQIAVYKVTVATGERELLVLTTDYTYDPDDVTPTSIITNSAFTDEYAVEVIRETSLTQLADYINNGAFPAEVHEAALDKIVMMIQELANTQESAITINPIDIDNDFDQQLPTSEPLGLLRVNADGDGFEFVLLADLLEEELVLTNITNLQNDMTAVQEDVADHESRIVSLESVTATHESRLNTLDSEVDALQDAVDSQDARISNNESDIADHENRISNLELGMASAGGSGSFQFYAPAGGGAVVMDLYDRQVFAFSKDATQRIVGEIKSTIAATSNQKSLTFEWFGTQDNVNWTIYSYLIKAGMAVDSGTYNYTESAESTITGDKQRMTTTLNFSDANGQIGLQDIDDGDTVLIKIVRDIAAGTEYDADAYIMPVLTQISFT